MNYSKINKFDIANGPGIRVSIFISGCRHQCKGCFNRDTWDFDYGQRFEEKDINTIIDSLSHGSVSGLTILGGEPLDPKNQRDVLYMIQRIKDVHPETNIWIYTGYTLGEGMLSNYRDGVIFEILNNIDTLVDGKFVEELADLRLLFKGSSNQRIINTSLSIQENTIILQ